MASLASSSKVLVLVRWVGGLTVRAGDDIELEHVVQLRPKLRSGEIVSVCGDAQYVVVCRQDGNMSLIKRSWSPSPSYHVRE